MASSAKTVSSVSGTHSGRGGKFGSPLDNFMISLQKKYNAWRDQVDGVSREKPLLDLRDNSVISPGSVIRPAPAGPAPAGSPAVPTPSSAPAVQREWSNADIARLYNMSNETAYQEALSNTSYQRAVKDMQAAGLNPAALFAAGRVSGADGVGYVSSASGDSSGGYYGSSSSLSSAKAARRQYLFSNGTYNWIKVAAAGATLMATKSPYKAMTAYSAAGYLLKAFNGSYQSRK